MLNDIAQVLDLGLTGVLLVAVVALWLDGKQTRAQLIDILKTVAGIQAQGVQTMDQKFYVVWLDKSGNKSGQGFSAEGFQNWLEDHPRSYRYYVQVDNCLYSLGTTETKLMGLEYEQAQELAKFMEVPF